MLTQDFKQSIQSGTASPGGTTASPGQPMTPEQFQQWSGGSSQPSGYLQRVGEDIQSNIKEGGETLAPYLTNEKGIFSNETPGQGFADAASIAKNVTNPLWSLLTAATSPTISKIAQNPAVQGFGHNVALGAKQFASDIKPVGAAVDIAKAHPTATKAASDLLQTGMNVGFLPLSGAARTVARTGAQAASDALKTTPERAAQMETESAAAQQATHAAQLKSVADEWRSPTIQRNTPNPAQFNVARRVLTANPDAPETLVALRLHPAQYVENGRYATPDIAHSIREDAGQLSRDYLRPALREADLGTPKISVEPIYKKALANIAKDPLITPEEEESISQGIARGAALLEKKYPDGMKLSNMEDQKIAHGSRGGYRGDGSVADNNAAAAHRALSKALADTIGENVPPGVEYGKFKEYLSKLYGAADYLDALNNKRAPVTSLAAVARKSARIGGFLAGHAMGGGVLPGVAGYAIGGTLENVVENMTLSLRGKFLQALELTNPEALKSLSKYSAQEEAARAARPLLPPGKSPGTPGAPTIELPAAKGESSVTSIPAQKNPVSVNPKTGRFQTSYSSSPQEPRINMNTMIANALSDTKESGGSTVDIYGERPTEGYSVSIGKSTEHSIPKEQFTDVELRQYAGRLYDLLKDSKGGNKLGTWEHEGRVYMDVVRVYDKEADAFAQADRIGDTGYYDFKGKNTILTSEAKARLGINGQSDEGGVRRGGTETSPPSGAPSIGENQPQKVNEKGVSPAGEVTAKNLPKMTLYHGADSATAAKIKSGGFRPSTDMPGYGMVSLTSDAKVAQNYANIGGKGEVMKVRIKPNAKIKEYSSMEEYTKAMEATGKKTAGEMETALNAPYDVVKINDLILAKPEAIQLSKNTSKGQ